MKIAIECTYCASTTTTIDLPDGKTWDDVAEWYIKWSVLHVTFKNGARQEFVNPFINTIDVAEIDAKRPNRAVIYATDEDGDIDYELDAQNA